MSTYDAHNVGFVHVLNDKNDHHHIDEDSRHKLDERPNKHRGTSLSWNVTSSVSLNLLGQDAVPFLESDSLAYQTGHNERVEPNSVGFVEEYVACKDVGHAAVGDQLAR